MARVQMYPEVEVNTIVSHLGGVIGAVRATAGEGAARASGVLAGHRHEGHAEINVTHGDVDSFVNLDDTRGQSAAAAIEFGRSGGRGGSSQGIGALARAF